MEINEYLRIISVRWRLVALLTLLGALAGSAVAMFVERTTTATADIEVHAQWGESSIVAADSVGAARIRLMTYAALAAGDEVAAAAARQVGEVTAEQLQRQVTAADVGGGLILRISATATRPGEAVAIADAVADALVEMAAAEDRGAGGVSVNSLDKVRSAQLTRAPQSAVVVLGSAGVAGGIAGLVLGAFAGIWREQRNRT